MKSKRVEFWKKTSFKREGKWKTPRARDERQKIIVCALRASRRNTKIYSSGSSLNIKESKEKHSGWFHLISKSQLDIKLRIVKLLHSHNNTKGFDWSKSPSLIIKKPQERNSSALSARPNSSLPYLTNSQRETKGHAAESFPHLWKTSNDFNRKFDGLFIPAPCKAVLAEDPDSILV